MHAPYHARTEDMPPMAKFETTIPYIFEVLSPTIPTTETCLHRRSLKLSFTFDDFLLSVSHFPKRCYIRYDPNESRKLNVLSGALDPENRGAFIEHLSVIIDVTDFAVMAKREQKALAVLRTEGCERRTLAA